MDRRVALAVLAGLGSAVLAGCLGSGGDAGDGGSGGGTADTGSPDASIDETPTLESSAFDDGGPIPTRFTCDGANVSPALSVGDVPQGASSLALLVDDPDAPRGTFTHWLLWGVPASTESIPQGVPRGETVEGLEGARQGTNDAGEVGYSGPCPPRDDDAHTYRFRLFALASSLQLEPGADRAAFDDAVDGVARSETLLRGTYDR